MRKIVNRLAAVHQDRGNERILRRRNRKREIVAVQHLVPDDHLAVAVFRDGNAVERAVDRRFYRIVILGIRPIAVCRLAQNIGKTRRACIIGFQPCPRVATDKFIVDPKIQRSPVTNDFEFYDIIFTLLASPRFDIEPISTTRHVVNLIAVIVALIGFNRYEQNVGLHTRQNNTRLGITADGLIQINGSFKHITCSALIFEVYRTGRNVRRTGRKIAGNGIVIPRIPLRRVYCACAERETDFCLV